MPNIFTLNVIWNTRICSLRKEGAIFIKRAPRRGRGAAGANFPILIVRGGAVRKYPLTCIFAYEHHSNIDGLSATSLFRDHQAGVEEGYVVDFKDFAALAVFYESPASLHAYDERVMASVAQTKKADDRLRLSGSTIIRLRWSDIGDNITLQESTMILKEVTLSSWRTFFTVLKTFATSLR
ncbi:hypothetical protein EVAR_68113_1 [Eumeta japonica]|uniref:Uncharacterized protein n=1 Tax=Eumeta variegata TaxID=151549 RepID=A0A4C1ZDK4_EUMVA|nr:hypothetical protein EVAR_68113_1 [Eumeta japonica]